ncbi:MAG TPA: copper resistance protein CopC [Gaiellaceae bacterium]
MSDVRIPRTALLATAACLLAPASAWAHASLVRTEPANGAVLARSPAQVRVVFDDVVRPGPGIAAIRNGGASILAGRAHVLGARTLVIPLRRGLADGDYSVRWSIVSDDGHLESGVLAFAVGIGREPPVAGLSPQATGPTVDSVGARWLFFAGVLGAVGIALFTFVVRPREQERIPIIVSTGGVLAALGAAQEIHRVGLSTRDGKALGAGFVVALVVASLGAAATLDRRALRPALMVALSLAVVPSLAGHALDPGLARVNVVADVLHVLAAAGWTGVLLGVVAIRGADLGRAGVLALASVAVLGATGITRAAFELTGPAQLWETAYGRALLVKTGVLLGALALGRLLRHRAQYRAGVELALVAALVVAVAVLVELRPGRNVVVGARSVAQASEPSRPPPPPPAGAVVLAREAGPLGIAVAAETQRVTAIVLSPAGGGLSGLDVTIQGRSTAACGSGCYAANVPPGRTVTVEVAGFGPTRTASFALPARTPSAAALLRRIRAVYRALSSVTYRERLASDEAHVLVARWRLERPNRIAYSIAGGAQGIVIGNRRWDRDTPEGRWIESAQTPLTQPTTQWAYAANAHVLARTASATTVSFVDPTIPAFFTITLDRQTLRLRALHMTASAHFMTDTYLGFNAPRAIRPPH